MAGGSPMFDMRRREFINLLGGAAAAWPLAAHAQESKQLRRIGVLTSDAEDDPGVKARLAAFQQGLDGLGWSLDRNVRIYYRFATNNPDQYQPLAKELIRLQPDVLLAYTTPVAAAFARESRTIAGRPPCHIGLKGELPTYRVAVRARKEPAGTYTYVITRIDDPNWAERTGESYSTPEAASEAGWIALDRIRAVKKLDRS